MRYITLGMCIKRPAAAAAASFSSSLRTFISRVGVGQLRCKSSGHYALLSSHSRKVTEALNFTGRFPAHCRVTLHLMETAI